MPPKMRSDSQLGRQSPKLGDPRGRLKQSPKLVATHATLVVMMAMMVAMMVAMRERNVGGHGGQLPSKWAEWR